MTSRRTDRGGGLAARGAPLLPQGSQIAQSLAGRVLGYSQRVGQLQQPLGAARAGLAHGGHARQLLVGALDDGYERLLHVFTGQSQQTAEALKLGRLLVACPAFNRDHFIVQVGTGLRSGELLGLRARRVDLDAGRIEVVDVRYDAGRFGSGYKDRPKSDASIRAVPMAEPVARAPATGSDYPPDTEILPGEEPVATGTVFLTVTDAFFGGVTRSSIARSTDTSFKGCISSASCATSTSNSSGCPKCGRPIRTFPCRTLAWMRCSPAE